MKLTGRLMMTIMASVVIFSGSVMAQSKADSLFSHKGFKLSLGMGGITIPSEDRFEEGNGVMDLHLGYGFSSRSTLWFGLEGGEMKDIDSGKAEHFFAGMDLTYQYKFIADGRFQPYGKVGIGAYGIGYDDVDDPKRTVAGGGLIGALGFDYFFSRHFGIGAELNFKDITMISETVKDSRGKDVERDLEPHLNRDSRTFMITLTIQ